LYHIGNQAFRDLVQEHQTIYLCSKRSDKPAIAWKLYDIVTRRGGRFVRRNKARNHDGPSFAWEELDEKQSYEKICQSLREGAPALRAQLLHDTRYQNGLGGLLDVVDENKTGESLRDRNHEEETKEKSKESSSPRDMLQGSKEDNLDVYAV
jgi:hypothetical protein